MTRDPHLASLEAVSIEILREVAAECRNPVLMYSIGKDSTVLLHLARRAFAPAPVPFPLLHVDTLWKFREMIAFRDATAANFGLRLLVHTNPDGLERGVNPFDHGAAEHTRVMKTEALRQALDKYGFDCAIGGARRDEEASRAKERVFSVRGPGHSWDPRLQRPEFWSLFNARLAPGQSLRVFPLSDWTERDVWAYIAAERLDVVPLYFAADRKVVERDGAMIAADDPRMRLLPGETLQIRRVRFRSLGCWPLTGAILSEATTPEEIVAETEATRVSERGGRLIDRDPSDSMERKKREGYF